MATRNEVIRRQSVANFKAAIDQMAQDVAKLLSEDKTLPDLRITNAQYAAGRWPFPLEYRAIIERAVAQLIVHQQYELSSAQLHLACLQGATLAGKLWIDGVLQEAPTKRRITAIYSRRSPIRARTSIRGSVRSVKP